ncbi:MAG: YceI family protein [Rickettsiales bacterium]|nr:YceI family protein [Rickettsiales bacterium]
MRSHTLAIITASTIALTSACALAFSAPSTALDGVPSGTYVIDPSHTSVNFGISHLGFSTYQGRFNTIAGSLNFDPKAPEQSTLTVTIDAASIDTNHAELEGKLKSADWFDTAKFPTATFTSTSITKLTDTTGKLTGDLTLHGVTKPVTLDVTFNGAGNNPFANVPQLGFSAKGSIKRSDFGISQYLPAVGDEVSIMIESELHLKK